MTRNRLEWAEIGLSVPNHFGQLRSLSHFTGTRVVVLEGCGEDGHDLAREVTYWFDQDGHLIERRDPKDEIVEESDDD